jgi:hypothetical protein
MFLDLPLKLINDLKCPICKNMIILSLINFEIKMTKIIIFKNTKTVGIARKSKLSIN